MEELQNEKIVEKNVEKYRRWCVYMHTCKVNNKVYVGITSQNVDKRWQKGFGYLHKNKDGTYTQPLIAKAILKYSDWDNDWEHIIFAENLSYDDARTIERLLVLLYDTRNPSKGYNICPGGEPTPMYGRRHSQESKQKMQESNKIRFQNPENHPMFGKHHSDESKKQISDNKKNPSEESRSKMSKAKLKLYSSRDDDVSEFDICQYDKNGTLINKFCSTTYAYQETGISASAIRNCMCGLAKTAGGYIWRSSDKVLLIEDIIAANTRKKKQNNN
jgi:group I intron endonuclease